MKHLVIIGAGNFGREMYWSATMSYGYLESFDIKGYIDDLYDTKLEKYKNLQVPWLGKIDDYNPCEDDVFICSISDGKTRSKIMEMVKHRGGEFTNLINKTSMVYGNAKLGIGVFVGPYCDISDNVTIGDNVSINSHSSVGHDSVINNDTCIMSYVNITGNCVIGERVFIGSGCKMVPNTKIGDDAYVGIGSVLIRNVKTGTRVFGNPAKKMDF